MSTAKRTKRWFAASEQSCIPKETKHCSTASEQSCRSKKTKHWSTASDQSFRSTKTKPCLHKFLWGRVLFCYSLALLKSK